MWTAIVITSIKSVNVSAVQFELETLKKKGIIHKETTIITAEDPEIGIGSGSATLNALLAVAEHLSVINDYQIITADVFHDARVLIFHHGRYYPFDPIGKAFLSLPQEVTDNKNKTIRPAGLTTNLQAIFSLVTEIASSYSHGVWVSSTEMILTGKTVQPLKVPTNCDVLLFATLECIDYATHHGTIEVGNDDSIANIIYTGSVERLKQLSDDDAKVPVVSGIVYLSVPVAESLLSLHVIAPMDCCTYLGQDSGEKLLQVSLYFDILTTMTSEATESKFVVGDYCKSYNSRRGYHKMFSKSIQQARRLVWNELHKYSMKTYILQDMHHKYWNELGNANEHIGILKDVSNTSFNHVAVKDSLLPQIDLPLITNSFLQYVSLGENSVIQHCHLQGTVDNPIKVGTGSYLLDVHHVDSESVPFNLKNDLVLMETNVIVEDDRVMKMRILFGIYDHLFTPFQSIDATFCNIPWRDLFDHTEIAPSDLWDNHLLQAETSCLMNARLFPISTDMAQLDLMQNLHRASAAQIKRWKQSRRLSFHDVLLSSDLASNFRNRRQLFSEITSSLIKSILSDNKEHPLLPYLKCAVIEGWHMNLLRTLDDVAKSYDFDNWDPGRAARTLACIADLLGVMAGKDGGLRSGPAHNKIWENAFNILEKGNKGSIEAGVEALSNERKNWLNVPIKLTRAARHYEGAAQILIRQAVMTTNQFVHLDHCPLPPIGQWVIAECPARADLQGGWSDTPPICYELGGSVVNVSLLIDGKKPIGAKAKRIAEPHIELVMGTDEISTKRITINTMRDLTDYKNLSAAGALLKVAIVYTNMVDERSESSLKDQLLEKYGGGIQLQTWANLPQGSGLGTSSILAGAILAVLWSVTGHTWTKSSLVAGVLCLEQMLTTGGGWQDQVGGIMGGVNFASSNNSLPLKVEIEEIPMSPQFVERFNKHILLIYTGKVRLAKNLLQNVIRNWYARDCSIVECFQELVRNAYLCRKAFLEEDLSKIGALMNRYWQQKVIIAPGCDPTAIREMMDRLKPLVHGQTLAGAGGGGFIVLLTKQPHMKQEIEKLLRNLKTKVTVYDTDIDSNGMVVSVSND